MTPSKSQMHRSPLQATLKFSYVNVKHKNEETEKEETTMVLHSLTIKDDEEGNTVIDKETNPIDGNPYKLTSHDINLTVIEYQFEMPESNKSKSNSATADGKEGGKDGKNGNLEKRIIEINPYFQGGCYEL